MTTEIDLMVFDQKGSSPKVMPGIQHHIRHMLKSEADFAKSLIQSGMLAGVHEKNNNREKMSLLPPREVVRRACELAEVAYAEFEKRGWIVQLPSYEEMRAEITAQNEGSDRVGFRFPGEGVRRNGLDQ